MVRDRVKLVDLHYSLQGAERRARDGGQRYKATVPVGLHGFTLLKVNCDTRVCNGNVTSDKVTVI